MTVFFENCSKLINSVNRQASCQGQYRLRNIRPPVLDMSTEAGYRQKRSMALILRCVLTASVNVEQSIEVVHTC